MVDDRDLPLSSDEMLQAARDGSMAPPESAPSEYTGSPVEAKHPSQARSAGAERANSEQGRVRWVHASARIALIPPKGFRERIIGRKLDPLMLTVDGADTARIVRFWVSSKPFHRVGGLRVTKLEFDDGEGWQIHCLPRGPIRGKTTLGGKEREAHPIAERIVKVEQDGRTVAETVGPFPNRLSPLSKKTASIHVDFEGETYALSLGTSKGFHPTIQPTGEGVPQPVGRSEWLVFDKEQELSVDARLPVPLAVVLLQWHLLMGDWSSPRNYFDGVFSSPSSY